MLKRFYEKSKLWFAIMWVILYCVLMSVADNLSEMLGVDKLVTLIVGLALSAFILISHGVFNALSLFSNEASLTIGTRILTALALTLITGSYALYLALAFRRKKQ